ncbi:MAG TPA: hypothetical protein VEH30_11595 [Terriglobales bacterium]|nr:hypothetical protein [Terriglobales bacterium]
MKCCKISVFLVLFAAVCLPATAQTGIKVNVPFDFIAAGKTLPAGQYEIMPVWNNDNVAWQIFNTQGSAMLLTNSIESPRVAHRPSLVFSQAGERYFLVQIWSTQHFGRQMMLSNTKRTLVADNGQLVEIGTE